MVKKFSASLKTLEKSEVFKKWRKKDKESYLASCFTILGIKNDEYLADGIEWQIDYYSPSKDVMTSFLVSDNVEIREGEKILKDETAPIKELNVNLVKVDLIECIEKIRKKYKEEYPEKIISIAQNLDKVVWNITFLTTSFNVLNVKIDAENGNFLSETIKSVIEFKK
ncbi:MAG: hypothetical protein HYS32_03385 [Candidatus Woesearchaeota archaeon]|nr:MAG: hypothetical protein HYS32_03385 [Candidatus Woesearchaeota archaeon]